MGAGPNLASPLCRKVAESSLAHSVSTFNTTYRDTGLFGVYSVAEPTKQWELHAASKWWPLEKMGQLFCW